MRPKGSYNKKSGVISWLCGTVSSATPVIQLDACVEASGPMDVSISTIPLVLKAEYNSSLASNASFHVQDASIARKAVIALISPSKLDERDKEGVVRVREFHDTMILKSKIEYKYI